MIHYTIKNLTPDEIMLLGEGLDLLPYGRVSALVIKVQAQITQQEADEQSRIELNGIEERTGPWPSH